MLIAFAALAGGQAQAAARCDPFTAFPLVLNFGAGVNTGSGEDLNCFAKKTQAAINAVGGKIGQPLGSATLDANGKLASGQIPGINALGATIYRFPSSHFADSVSIRDFGAKGDNATDNTFAVQQAVNAASGLGQTVRIPASVEDGGTYRLGTVDWKKTNIAFDEGVKLLNLDGTRYSGGYNNASGAGGLIGLINPGFYADGRRVMSPTGNSVAFARPGDREAVFSTWGGHVGLPYLVMHSTRDAFLYGQTQESSGSVATDGRFLTIFNASNGPGFNIQCTATNGSAVLTGCTPGPTATHNFTLADGSLVKDPATGNPYNIPNVFDPCHITTTSGGIAANTYALSWDASTITLGAANSYTAQAPYTGASGTITINAQCGRTEFNHASWHMDMVGSTGNGGASGGLNFYNDIFAPTNISADPLQQEGFQSPLQLISYKQTPGLTKDRLHNGSYGLVVVQAPVAGQKTYTMHDGAAITGWSGSPGLSGGQDPNATAAAENGLRIGGPCASIYCYASQRSWYKTGLNIQDYETGIILSSPKAANNGTAIYAAPGAGNITVSDNLIVGTAIIQPNPGTPASPTAACTIGQQTWDVNYEYRCVATNRWRRTAFAADWP
jgi:hypothetical protein